MKVSEIDFAAMEERAKKRAARNVLRGDNNDVVAARLIPFLNKRREWSWRLKHFAQGLLSITSHRDEGLFWNGRCFASI